MKTNIRLVAALFLAAAATVQASNYTWVPTSGTGSFQEQANWNPSTGVPGAADNALFTGAGTYAVTFSGAVTNTGATVGAGSPGADVTFDLNGWLWRLTGALGFANVGTARFGGGTLQVVTASSVGANQKLVLNGGTSAFDKTLTTASGGTLEVGGGTHAFGLAGDGGTGLTLNGPPSGGDSLRLTNGTVNIPGQFYGNIGSGAKVSLEGGSLLIPSTGYGFVFQGSGTINVYTNATIDNRSGRFYLGRQAGVTTLNILGGVITNSNSAAVMHIAGPYANGVTGIVNLVDGLLYSSAQVGLSGSSGAFTNSLGLLRQTGGRLHVANTLALGNKSGSVGIYTQENGTAWCSTLSAGHNTQGPGSVGILSQTGGTLAVAGTLYAGFGLSCTGYMYQTGGGLVVSNNLILGGATNAYGAFRADGGSAWINGSAYLGHAPGAVGRMTLDGSSSLYIKNSLYVGSGLSGTGELVIAGGTLERPTPIEIGVSQGSFGRMTKTGGDLLCGTIYVGNSAGATGELVIAGGTLAVTNQYALFAGGYSGKTGAVGRIEISGGTNLFADARIGHQSWGLLRISGGQTYVTNDANTFAVGNQSGSTGRLEMAGGVLTARYVYGNLGYAEALLDGGTLQCSPNSAGVLFGGFDLATLTDRGAVFDTAGRPTAVTQILANEPGYAGAFTKRGEGTLTLTSPDNTFTGRVTVEAGELLVSGALYLTGGVRIDGGALLNLASATVPDATTASGTVSRIDGTLRLKAGGALTNGLGAALCGGGTVTGSVVFAAGSAWAHAKADYTGPLHVTGDTVFEDGAAVSLTGYTVEELTAGVPLVEIVGSGSVQVSGRLPVTLDGASHPYWRASVSNGGKTLTARMIPTGTMIQVR